MPKIINKPNRILSFASQSTGPRPRFLPSTFGLLFTFHLSLLILSCGLDVEDPTPPSPPQWVPKSLPEEWPERGIDAHESGGIFLEWMSNSKDIIKSYFIYRAEHYPEFDSLGRYEQIFKLNVDTDTNFVYVDTAIKKGISYYYKLKALDLSDNLSSYSDSLSYNMLPQIGSNVMTPNGLLDSLNSVRTLNWYFAYFIQMENYCLTILDHNNELVCRSIFSPSNYVTGYEYWQIPDSIALDLGQIYKWRIEINAKYTDGVESAGSESPWATFVYAPN